MSPLTGVPGRGPSARVIPPRHFAGEGAGHRAGAAMGTGRAEVDWQRIYGAVTRDLDPGVADRKLLRRFADERDEAAFAALVRRHAARVLATGRRVLGDAHHAEDVC